MVDARFEMFMRAAVQGIAFVDDQTQRALVNAVASAMLRVPEGEVDASVLLAAMRERHRNLSYAEEVAAEFARVLAHPEAAATGWIWEFTDPKAITLRVSSVPVHDATVRGRLWLFDDITAERALRHELEQQHGRERRREQYQLEAVRRLTAGIAHDFSNLLTVISGSAEMLSAPQHAPTGGVPPDRDSAADLQAIRQATQRAKALIRQLLALSGAPAATPERLELDPLLQRLSAELAAELDDQGRFVLVSDAPGAHVRIDERHLSLALMTFVANVREHLPVDGRIIVRSMRVQIATSIDPHAYVRMDARTDRYVAVTVGDSAGPHLSEIVDDLHKFLGEVDGGGASGEFGLGIASAVAEQAGGMIRCAHPTSNAAQYTLYLPEAHAVATGPRQMTPALGVAAWNELLAPMLVVDDDAGPRRVLRRLLEREGYTVLTADSAVDALRQLEANDGRVSGVISDYLMPGTTGMELLTAIRSRWPVLPFVLVSGFTYDDVTGDALQQLHAQFLPKPFTRDELLTTIRAAAAAMQTE